MTRRELLVAAEAIVGHRIAPHILAYAIESGHVSPAEKRSGWRDFSQSHVQELVDFVKTRSRAFRTLATN